MKRVVFIILLLAMNLGVWGQRDEALFTIEGDSIQCDRKHVEPFFWDYQNESYTLEKSCSFSSRDKKYNYTVVLSDYDVARGDGGCFRIIDVRLGDKTILQLHQSDGWDKIPERICDLSCQGYFFMEALSDSVTVLVFRGFLYNSEPELLTIVVLNKGTAKLVFNKNFIISEIKKTDDEFYFMLQDRVIEYAGDKPVKNAEVYKLWKENEILRFGGPYESVEENVWAGQE